MQQNDSFFRILFEIQLRVAEKCFLEHFFRSLLSIFFHSMINCRSHGCCCWLFWFVNEKDFSTKQFNGFSSEPRPQKQNLQLLTFLHKCKVFRGRGPLIAELEFSSETWEWFLPWEFFESLFEQVFYVDGISKKLLREIFFAQFCTISKKTAFPISVEILPKKICCI